MAKPILRDRSRYAGVDVLKLRLLAAVGGVSVSVACAGRSLNHDDGGGSSGNGGSSAVSGKAGKGGTGGAGGTGGSVGGATSFGGAGGDYPLMGGKGGTTGGVGGSTGGVGGNLGGAGGTMGGTAGMAGEPSTLGCTPAGEYAPGFEYCTGSYVHRSEPRACEQSPRSARGADENGGAAGVPGGGVAEPPVQCADDFDCKDAPNGHCVIASPAAFTVGPQCIYSCAIDDECGAGSICACSPGTNYRGVLDPGPVWLGICMTAGCTTDADCPDSLCVAATADVCGPHVPGPFHCQVPEDECSGPGDCSANATSGFMCSPSGTHYICTSAMCGRPFLVGGAIRQSELTVTAAWLDQALANEPSHELDAASQQAIAAHWSQAGLTEHASIAAFARFSLQLMALGAPAELVAAATAAMADETRHAKLCFGLAARYAERPVGPGPLDVSGALGAVNLLEVVDLVVSEGCIGETAAALEASWAAAAATDPLVGEVLAGIAEDEARHAELAHRFVAWAAEHDARVLARVKRTLRDALAADECENEAAPADATREAVLEAHGVLSTTSRRAARSAALREILPSLVARLEALAESDPEALQNDRSEAPRQLMLGER